MSTNGKPPACGCRLPQLPDHPVRGGEFVCAECDGIARTDVTMIRYLSRLIGGVDGEAKRAVALEPVPEAPPLPEWDGTNAVAELFGRDPDYIRANAPAYGGLRDRPRGHWRYPLRRLAENPGAFAIPPAPPEEPRPRRVRSDRADLLPINRKAA